MRQTLTGRCRKEAKFEQPEEKQPDGQTAAGRMGIPSSCGHPDLYHELLPDGAGVYHVVQNGIQRRYEMGGTVLV